jgi:hypothetical protein
VSLNYIQHAYVEFYESLKNKTKGKGKLIMSANSNPVYNLRANAKVTNSFKSQLGVRDTAQYIADMVLELRNLARSVELITLQGLLEVSFYEAFSAANRVEIPPDEIEHLRELSKASGS